MELSHWAVGLGWSLVLVGSGAKAAEMRVTGVEVEVGGAEAEAGMPVTMSRLCSPLEKEETLKALRSVMCAGADQIILEVLNGGGGVDGEADVVTIDVAISVMTTVLVLVVVVARVGGDVVTFEENEIERAELIIVGGISDGGGSKTTNCDVTVSVIHSVDVVVG